MQLVYGILIAVVAIPFVNAAETPNCALLFNSPQFAILCNLSDVTIPINTIPGLGMTGIISGLQKLSANAVCDADCRCVMGATKGGGKCGKLNGKAYCQCDYNPAKATTNPLQDGCALLKAPLTLCALQKNGTAGLQSLCNADCVCSHGYPSDTAKNQCTKNTAVSGDQSSYCFCNNGAAPPAG